MTPYRAFLFAVFVCGAAACSSRVADRAAPALHQVVLPDLSGVAASVQRQALAREDALAKTLEDHAAPERQAEAFGDLGKLLLAADFADAAEPCFVDAQLLEP